MELKGKNIGLAMTGSFCTFAKMEQEIRKLKETGAILYPIFSSNVQTTDSRFGDTGDFIRRITGTAGNPPILRVEEAEPLAPRHIWMCFSSHPAPATPWLSWPAGLRTHLCSWLPRPI